MYPKKAASGKQQTLHAFLPQDTYLMKFRPVPVLSVPHCVHLNDQWKKLIPIALSIAMTKS